VLGAAGIRVLPIARQTNDVGGTAASGQVHGAANALDLIKTFGEQCSGFRPPARSLMIGSFTAWSRSSASWGYTSERLRLIRGLGELSGIAGWILNAWIVEAPICREGDESRPPSAARRNRLGHEVHVDRRRGAIRKRYLGVAGASPVGD
jgi:hypothetical protein